MSVQVIKDLMLEKVLKPDSVVNIQKKNLAKSLMKRNETIIFYDGYCALCSNIVRWLKRVDTREQFQFLPQQSEKAMLYLKNEVRSDEVILVSSGKRYAGASALIKALILLGGGWKFSGWLLSLLPKFILKWFYSVIAKNRYQWFGRPSCEIPGRKAS